MVFQSIWTSLKMIDGVSPPSSSSFSAFLSTELYFVWSQNGYPVFWNKCWMMGQDHFLSFENRNIIQAKKNVGAYIKANKKRQLNFSRGLFLGLWTDISRVQGRARSASYSHSNLLKCWCKQELTGCSTFRFNAVEYVADRGKFVISYHLRTEISARRKKCRSIHKSKQKKTIKLFKRAIFGNWTYISRVSANRELLSVNAE